MLFRLLTRRNNHIRVDYEILTELRSTNAAVSSLLTEVQGMRSESRESLNNIHTMLLQSTTRQEEVLARLRR